jgi:hypothetical protein
VDWTHAALAGAFAVSLLLGLRHRRHRTIRITIELERDDTDNTDRKGDDHDDSAR